MNSILPPDADAMGPRLETSYVNPLGIKHLSPSALKIWESDREEWFLRYCTGAPRMKQTLPMAIGSGFDATAKRGIWRCLGEPEKGDEVYAAVVAGIDSSLRDEALRRGDLLWQGYKRDAFATLLSELQAGERVVMESDLTIVHEGVRVRGKPDLFWSSKAGTRNILDWKATGMCSKQSPRPGFRWDTKTRLPYAGSAKVCPLGDPDWLMQVTTYGWMDGVCVGDLIGHIHQLVGPDRVVHFRDVIGLECQRGLWDRYKGMWESIGEGRVFTDLGEIADVERQNQLKERARVYNEDPMFAFISGRG